ncbi:MAG: AAA family ATPase [Spirochaetales bacterium]|nr:AAA family ATPase [Spirochaetales bacterium]
MLRCPNCGFTNPSQASFCMRCGTALKAVCLHCDAPVAPDAPSCPNCGRSPRTIDAAAQESPSAPNPDVPTVETAAHAAHLDGERRMVTILFADVVGSTSLAEKMDPESWTRIMNRAFDRILPSIYLNRGTIARLMGDALLAFFGAPIAREDDPQRAVKAAADLLEAARQYAEEVRLEYGIEFAIRVGVNTGPVVVGEVGSYPMKEYTAMGDAVNVAQRLQSVAEPDSVLLAGRTYRLVAPFFEAEDRGLITVKGKSRTVQAYRLVGKRSDAGEGARFPPFSSPLVGRERQLSELKGRIEELLRGSGGVLCITGETGIGKSRLLAELRGSVFAPALTWLEGSTLSSGQSTSYRPFRQMLRRYMQIEEEEDPGSARHKLDSALRSLFPSPAGDSDPVSAGQLSAHLGNLLVLGDGEQNAGGLDYAQAEARSRQMLLTVRRFFERLAQSRPLVLVIEDLQWLDESSAILLEHLLPLCEQVPLLLCGLSRPEPEGPAAAIRSTAARRFQDRYTEIPLTGLSPPDSARLAGNLLGARELPPRLEQLIFDKSEGNPLFLEELIRVLIDQKSVVLSRGSGRWQFAGEIDLFAIPNTIQGVISARLDRLEESSRRVLRNASVIGRSFLYRVLKEVDESGETLDWQLAILLQLQLIEEKRREPELEYGFRNPLIQEAAYERILQNNRKELHRLVGEAIERIFAARLEPYYGLIAFHYARAEVWDKAHRFLLRAGDQAGRMAGDAEALSYYRRALEAFVQAFGARWDPLQRATLKRKIGEALFRQGRNEAALENLVEALRDLKLSLPQGRGPVRRAIVGQLMLQLIRRLTESARSRRPAASAAASAAVQPTVKETIRIYRTVSWIDTYANIERLFWLTLRGLNLSERHGYTMGIAQSAAAAGYAFDVLGKYRLAWRYHRRALLMGAEAERPGVIGLARLTLAHHRYCIGDLDGAIAQCLGSAAAYREAGDLHGWGSAVQIIAYARIYQGEYEQAGEQADALVRLGRDGGEQQVLAWGLAARGALEWRTGEIEAARRNLEEAIGHLDRIPDHLRAVRARAELARCLLRLGRPREAVALLEQGRSICTAYKLKGVTVAPMHNARSEACLFRPDSPPFPGARAAARGNPRLAEARRSCREALKQGRAIPLVLPEAMLLAGSCERWHGRSAAARKLWQQGLMAAETQGQRRVAAAINEELDRL